MASGRKPSLPFFKHKRGKSRGISRNLQPVKVIARAGKILEVPEVIVLDKFSVQAQALRQSAPRSERILWERIEPMGFIHSAPLHGYFADFYHPGARVCIEVDGGVHAARRVQDRRRDRVLYLHGIRTYRFTAAAVYADADEVAMHVKNILTLATRPTVA